MHILDQCRFDTRLAPLSLSLSRELDSYMYVKPKVNSLCVSDQMRLIGDLPYEINKM